MQVSSYLFHGTGVYALAAIAESNELREGVHWHKPGEPHGPRLTRRFDIAATFCEYNMHWGEGGVLVLDRAVLERAYRVEPYSDTYYGGDAMERDEEEMAVITPSITDLSRYLVSIVCDPQIIKFATDPETLAIARDECGWAFDHDDDGLAIRTLERLGRHPLLNRWVPASGFPCLGNWLDKDPPVPFELATPSI